MTTERWVSAIFAIDWKGSYTDADLKTPVLIGTGATEQDAKTALLTEVQNWMAELYDEGDPPTIDQAVEFAWNCPEWVVLGPFKLKEEEQNVREEVTKA